MSNLTIVKELQKELDNTSDEKLKSLLSNAATSIQYLSKEVNELRDLIQELRWNNNNKN